LRLQNDDDSAIPAFEQVNSSQSKEFRVREQRMTQVTQYNIATQTNESLAIVSTNDINHLIEFTNCPSFLKYELLK
jgi:hypothetical protein